jgi:hypothetical protein
MRQQEVLLIVDETASNPGLLCATNEERSAK